MLLGEIKRNGEGFPQHESIIVDGGKPPVGINREKFGATRAGSADLGRDVLVGEPQFLGDPEGAERAGTGDAVDAEHVSEDRCQMSEEG